MVKNVSKALVVLSLLALLVLAGCVPEAAAIPVIQQQIPAAVTETPNKLTVSASGTVSVMPDVAYISVGVTTQSKNMKKAQSDNKDKMNTLYAALRSAGIAESDIRTTQYAVYPIQDYRDSAYKITGYHVVNSIELTVRDIEKAGEYLDIAAENGANTANSVRFGLLDEKVNYNAALALAMEAAKQKAAAIADAGGHTITGTLEITEISAYEQVFRNYDSAMMAEAESASTPILAGELSVTARISVVYEIG